MNVEIYKKKLAPFECFINFISLEQAEIIPYCDRSFVGLLFPFLSTNLATGILSMTVS